MSQVVDIDVTCHLEGFSRFLVSSTCRSFIPESYLRDPEVFPEKEMDPGSIYIEAADKVTLKKIRDITFVNAQDILGIIYTSKSGHTKLKWRQTSGPMGRLTGDASANSLVNLSMARIITQQEVEEILRNAGTGQQEPMEQQIGGPGASGEEPGYAESGQTAAEILGVEPEERKAEEDETE